MDGVIDARSGDDGTEGAIAPGPALGPHDLDRTRDLVVRLARRVVPGADHVALVDGGAARPGAAPRVVHAGSGTARVLERLQTDLAEGPRADLLGDRDAVLVPDLREHVGRWPRFAPAALAHGVHAVLAVRVGTAAGPLGVLSAYGERPDALTDDSRHVALLLAAHTQLTTAALQQVEQLRLAVQSRDVIGQAKGLLMERHGVDADRAFDVLVRYSRAGNTKLRDVADALVTTRTLPDEDGRPAGPGGGQAS